MQKVIKYFATTVIVLFFLSIFGWTVKHIAKGDKQYSSIISEPIKALIDFPDLFKASVKEVKTLPATFIKTPENLNAFNNLESNVNALITYSTSDSKRTIELRNLKNNETLYQWNVNNPHNPQSRIMDPLLLPNKEIVYSYNGVTGLIKIDSLGNQIWKQPKMVHHHALNLDSIGNIWACSYLKDGGEFLVYKGTIKLDTADYNFIDNSICYLDANTGEILVHKSIADILLENKLEHLIIKSDHPDDPFHLNDIEPALSSTEHYHQGDLFLSLRHISCILHYRPSTNKVIEVIEGAFYSQHDVDIISDSTLSLFNNNSHIVRKNTSTTWRAAKDQKDYGTFYSNVIGYNLNTKAFFDISRKAFDNNSIFTYTEGKAEQLPDGSIFIEEQNSGLIWVLKDDKAIYKGVYKSQHEGYHHLPNWTRIIND
jgi:hypothetical protein